MMRTQTRGDVVPTIRVKRKFQENDYGSVHLVEEAPQTSVPDHFHP